MEHSRTDLSRRSLLKHGSALGAAALLPGLVEAQPSREPGPKQNELLVGIDEAEDLTAARANIESDLPSNATVVHENETLGYAVVKLPDVATASEQATTQRQLEGRSEVRYVEENATATAFRAAGQPDDQLFSKQYAPQLVNAPSVWETVSGQEDVTIAVLDTGVAYDHPDLEAQFGSDKGRDFVDDDDDPYPDKLYARRRNEIHGTHVSGIAAGERNNDEGIAGISDATLLSGRVLDEKGSGGYAAIADGLQWAADRGVPIINMSLGGPVQSETLHQAVKYAVEQGSLPIAAAGNDAQRNVSYPAAYDEVVAVAGINEDEQPYDGPRGGTNYGPEIDVAAPGQQVLSAWPDTPSDTEYRSLNGTSMATPVVSGVAALGLAAADDTLTPEKLRQYLEESAVDIGLSAEKQGAGRVDAAQLVTAVSDNRTFVDVPQDHWAFYQIESLLDNDVISGYEDGTFQPEASITRAEVAAMLTKAFDLESGDASFDDTEDHWAKEAINAAASAGFLGGYPDGSFKPNAKITRQEIIVALSSGLTEQSDLDVENQLAEFSDADAIADWARRPIARANAADLLENDLLLSEDSDTQSATASTTGEGFWSAFSFENFLLAADAEGEATELQPETETTRAAAANFLWNLLSSDQVKEF